MQHRGLRRSVSVEGVSCCEAHLSNKGIFKAGAGVSPRACCSCSRRGSDVALIKQFRYSELECERLATHQLHSTARLDGTEAGTRGTGTRILHSAGGGLRYRGTGTRYFNPRRHQFQLEPGTASHDCDEARGYAGARFH
jgi:hypothetical protein